MPQMFSNRTITSVKLHHFSQWSLSLRGNPAQDLGRLRHKTRREYSAPPLFPSSFCGERVQLEFYMHSLISEPRGKNEIFYISPPPLKPKTLPRRSCTVTDMRICERSSPPSNLGAFATPEGAAL